MLIILLVSACAPSASSNPADHDGTWAGTMSFTGDDNRKEDIVITGCAAGSVCGDLNNTTVNCQWEMTLATVNEDVFQYTLSNTLTGEDISTNCKRFEETREERIEKAWNS